MSPCHHCGSNGHQGCTNSYTPQPSPDINVHGHPCFLWASLSALSPVARRGIWKRKLKPYEDQPVRMEAEDRISRGPGQPLSSLLAVGSLFAALWLPALLSPWFVAGDKGHSKGRWWPANCVLLSPSPLHPLGGRKGWLERTAETAETAVGARQALAPLTG